jgi:hypothetical protein
MIRLMIRGSIAGVEQFADYVETDDSGDQMEALGESHALRLLALPGGKRHMIEIEFLDEPDPLERFFRFGTDPDRMVIPIRLPLPPDFRD